MLTVVLGGPAEFERELIRARTGEGRERPRRGAWRWDASLNLPITRTEAIRRRERGDETLAEIGRSYNVSGISRLSKGAT